jgi:hypothetical protein
MTAVDNLSLALDGDKLASFFPAGGIQRTSFHHETELSSERQSKIHATAFSG